MSDFPGAAGPKYLTAPTNIPDLMQSIVPGSS